MEFLRAATF